jgi:hypothetical protein
MRGDFAWVFCDDASDGGGAVAVVLVEGFEVGLDSCAAAIIGAGDGEEDGGVRFHSWVLGWVVKVLFSEFVSLS